MGEVWNLSPMGDKLCTQETAKHLSKSLKEDF